MICLQKSMLTQGRGNKTEFWLFGNVRPQVGLWISVSWTRWLSCGGKNEEPFLLNLRNSVYFHGAVLDLCWDGSQNLPVLSLASLKGFWVTIRILTDTRLSFESTLASASSFAEGNSSGAGLGTANIQSLATVSRFLVHPHMTMSSQKSRLHRLSNLGRTVDALQLLTSLDIVFWWSIHFRDLTGNEKERDNPSLLKRQKRKCGKYSSPQPQKYLNVLVIWVIATCSDSSNAKYVTEYRGKPGVHSLFSNE